MENLMETLEKEIQEIRAHNEGLREKIRLQKAEKNTVVAQEQARFILETFFAPYIDGACSEWGVSPEDALRILIDEKATFGKIAVDNPTDLKKLRNHPPVKKIIDMASPLKDVSDEWIKEKADILFKVMKDLRPELASIIAETPGGTEWFYDSLIGLREILYGKP